MKNRVLIIADDLTGSLDTAIPFALRGDRVEVYRRPPAAITSAADVVAINSESRHRDQESARDIVREIAAMGRAAGFPLILKKVDSLLRGNPGQEIQGALQGSGFPACYLSPALPAQGRVIRKGALVIVGGDGTAEDHPTDPLNPVAAGDLFALLAEETAVPLRSELQGADKPGIVIADADSDEELDAGLASALKAGFRLIAGSSGIGAALARLLHEGAPLPTASIRDALRPETPALIIAGSHNEVTGTQIRVLLESGAAVSIETGIDPENETELKDAAEECRRELIRGRTTILSTRRVPRISLQDARRAALTLAKIALRSISAAGTVAVIGGDTLDAILAAAGAETIVPLAEPAPGTVAFSCPTETGDRLFLSRSGAFGGPEYFSNLLQEVYRNETDRD